MLDLRLALSGLAAAFLCCLSPSGFCEEANPRPSGGHRTPLPGTQEGGTSPNPVNAKTSPEIVIGLFVPLEGENRFLGVEIRRGAEMAVAHFQANKDGATPSARLEVRSSHGTWGRGTSRLVELVSDERVCALVAGVDHREAHFAAQIATKARVSMVTPWAAVPSLTQAGVPWVFRIVPDFDEQASLLCQELLKIRKVRNPVILRGPTRDDEMAAESFAKAWKRLGGGALRVCRWQTGETDGQTQAPAIRWEDHDGFVLCTSPGETAEILAKLGGNGTRIAGFGFLALSLVETLPQGRSYAPEVGFLNVKFEDEGFRRAYLERYGRVPTPAAASSYDAVDAILRAAGQVGTDRDAVRRWLAASDFEGVTGKVTFTKSGNRAPGSCPLSLEMLKAKP